MPEKTNPDLGEAIYAARDYGSLAVLLHWVIVALLAAQYAVGWLMPHIGRDTPNEGLVSWHLSIGVAILAVMVFRLAWQVTHPVALLPATAQWQNQLAQATHVVIYLLVIINPMLGWAAADYRGWDVVLFGFITLPVLAAKGTPWAHTAGDVHIFLIYALLGVLALHVLAALYHHFVQHDRVLRRMLPGGTPAA